MRTNFTLVAASISATLTTMAFAGPPAVWENVVVANGTNEAPSVPGGIMVPNSMNNPVIDGNGNITIRVQLAGAGITTANSRIILTGKPGAWLTAARDGSPVPGGFPTGYVFNSTTGINGLASSNNISENGGILASGNINGAGNTALLDTAMYFLPRSGTPFNVVRESDPCPGTAGAIMSSAMTAGSGQQTNDLGQSLFATAMTGGDTVTTGAGANNSAIVLLTDGADQLILRKGVSGSAYGYPGLTITPDTFGLWLTGSKVAFSAKLVGTGITTANDAIYMTSFGANPKVGLRVWAREGDAIPGFAGLTIANTSSLSFSQHPMANDGTILFIATLGGSADATNNAAVMTEKFGTFNILMRKGDSIPGITDSTDPNFAGKVFQQPNTSAFVKNRNGLLAFQGIFMNPDGSGIVSPAPSTFFGVRSAEGVVTTILRQGDPVVGLAAGWVYSSINGSTSPCVSDAGVVVFSASIVNATIQEDGSAIMAWDAANGLRVLAKATTSSVSPFGPTGDTNFTGTPCNACTLIGSTGNNGDGGHTGLSSNGWLTLRASDSVSAIYTVARIYLGATGVPCPSDLNADGSVTAPDLSILLSAWGTGGGDINGDGTTNAIDLAALLSAWGACPQ
ncbi:MAG: hypothetical protein DWI09_01495 [Planctomycetota bacterium]|nr:MAG: hypothetical protein DWI09_01495 [Planctomycetota bacterium]